jgi:hypothetical protein
MVGMCVMICSTISFSPMTSAVVRASTAEAPHPFLKNCQLVMFNNVLEDFYLELLKLLLTGKSSSFGKAYL